MSVHVDSISEVADFFREQAKEANPVWRDKFEKFSSSLDAARKELVRQYGLTSALPPDLGNVHDLPAELLDELSVAKADELEDQLVTVVNAYGGEATLDQILVGLFRKFHVIQKRRFVQNKLYRMEMIWSVAGKKGVYTTHEPNDIGIDDNASPSPDVNVAYPDRQENEDDIIPF